ncbi:MAG TPA: penicillin-binding protein 2 [Vicinamibacterales bacterium]|nr:penicillin-binding protein 2 [Vicinamibacterales bacterium]HPW20562.1 penicillin-binding protein 2 [Vicinamibacterales bacterium]
MTGPPSLQRRRLASRLNALSVCVVTTFAALAVAFWYFQVVMNAEYVRLAENNHQRRLALRAPRGILYDREFRPLVENRDAYTISILREHSRDLDRVVRRLAEATGVAEQRIRDELDRHRSEPRYRPVVVIGDASLAQVSAVLARRLDFELPDVVVERVPTRRYPALGVGAHLLGYVGEASEAQVQTGGLRPGAVVGQSGVERAYNTELMGTDGERRVMVNSVGREIATLQEIAASEGRRLQLTIDLDLQLAAEHAFHALGYQGAAAFLDPRSGEVLALVSLPAYDPNNFATGIDRATWIRLNTDVLKPLQNRAIQGRYSPGSTFKAVVAAAALEEGIITPVFTVTCRGGATFYGRFFQCHSKSGHGPVDLRHAIEKSCNTYFYTVGNMVGIERLHKWAALLGLAGKTGIDLPNEVESLVPSPEWKKARTGEKWYAGETISVAIGQGQVSVTPISLANLYAAVANGGPHCPPRLLKAINDGQGWRPPDEVAAPEGPRLKPETVAALHDGFWLVVNGAGTGGRARIPGHDVAGKTGTAQVISLEGGRRAAGRTERDLRDHGWFAFFAPRDNPEIAGVVFAEHGEHGSSAAPIARHVLETYFAKREGRPLPAFEAPPGAPAPAAARGAGAGQ